MFHRVSSLCFWRFACHILEQGLSLCVDVLDLKADNHSRGGGLVPPAGGDSAILQGVDAPHSRQDRWTCPSDLLLRQWLVAATISGRIGLCRHMWRRLEPQSQNRHTKLSRCFCRRIHKYRSKKSQFDVQSNCSDFGANCHLPLHQREIWVPEPFEKSGK